ncbi:hypothetical protein LOK74_10150 [Brevibacillus humidisoli]|uniref:hypothetical protein n=1 Tax=Brevibacillus humidisoli TaxID=2895522 RepID=UPI001E628336|nr:hypothetical protein [Brevibacillus humidisoli]UFJ42823.1 hypothetical protein LOK74_10150 [Brevibacillus humidisoli]
MARLKKSDYLLTYMIIITFACFVGGFFLGANVMKARMSTELETATKAEREKAFRELMLKEQKLYREQDFVSFYYGVYLPLEEFRNSHFRYLANLQDKPRAEQLEISEEMKKVVEKHRKEAENGLVPSTSPLLVKAKTEYINSLKAYNDGIEQVLDKNNLHAFSAEEIAAGRHLAPFYSLWLRGQADLYKAIALWESAYITNKEIPDTVPTAIDLNQWKSYSFHFRNYLAAEYLTKQPAITSYNPEDLTARLDSVILTNQAVSLGWDDIPYAIRVLNATNAVRKGDYRSLRDRLYSDVRTPEMPIFTE